MEEKDIRKTVFMMKWIKAMPFVVGKSLMKAHKCIVFDGIQSSKYQTFLV